MRTERGEGVSLKHDYYYRSAKDMETCLSGKVSGLIVCVFVCVCVCLKSFSYHLRTCSLSLSPTHIQTQPVSHVNYKAIRGNTPVLWQPATPSVTEPTCGTHQQATPCLYTPDTTHTCTQPQGFNERGKGVERERTLKKKSKTEERRETMVPSAHISPHPACVQSDEPKSESHGICIQLSFHIPVKRNHIQRDLMLIRLGWENWWNAVTFSINDIRGV